MLKCDGAIGRKKGAKKVSVATVIEGLTVAGSVVGSILALTESSAENGWLNIKTILPRLGLKKRPFI
jgi:hypothetical protein